MALRNMATRRHTITICRHTVDLSIPVGASYEYMNVILDARYNFGLTNIYKIDAMKSKNRFFTITVGYRFNL